MKKLIAALALSLALNCWSLSEIATLKQHEQVIVGVIQEMMMHVSMIESILAPQDK